MPAVLKINKNTNHGTDLFLAARQRAKPFHTASQMARITINQTKAAE